MWLLLGTAITSSFFDSLNPSAIAQQMLLQAMVKNKRHIWFFILGIGLANWTMGLAVYYGIATWISRLLSKVTEAYPWYVYGAALGSGFLCLVVGIRLIFKTKQGGYHDGDNDDRDEGDDGKVSIASSPARLSPLSLFAMGGVFCAVELTSAFPYFGFLAMLTSYDPPFPFVLIFLFIYSFMYVLPLILLYFGYNKLRGTTAIQRLEHILGKVSSYIVPVVIILIGAFLIYYGVSSLL